LARGAGIEPAAHYEGKSSNPSCLAHRAGLASDKPAVHHCMSRELILKPMKKSLITLLWPHALTG